MREEDKLAIVKQISVFLENRPGTLATVTDRLAADGVNLKALSIAETERFGILRLIADDTDRALDSLRELGLTIRVTDVVAVEVPDRPGGLASILTVFASTGVSIAYMYAELAGGSGRAVLIMRLDPAEEGLRLLQQAIEY